MPATAIKSYWSSGGLVFRPAPAAIPPSTMIQVGDTNGFVLAAGCTAVYGYMKPITTAITGTVRGLKGNATCLIASTSGTMIGVEGRAGNGSSGVSTDGVNLGSAIGVYGYVVGSGGTSTITTAEGIRAHLDIDITGLTVTTAY